MRYRAAATHEGLVKELAGDRRDLLRVHLDPDLFEWLEAEVGKLRYEIVAEALAQYLDLAPSNREALTGELAKLKGQDPERADQQGDSLPL